MDSLPADVMRLVMAKLGTRSLLCLASTCREYRDLAATVPLKACFTPRHNARLYQRWLTAEGVAERVEELTARRTAWGPCPWLQCLPSLTRVTIAFSRVTTQALVNVCDTIQHLDVHRVRPNFGSSEFCTSVLGRLSRLHTLRLTFSPGWDVVSVRGLPQHLRELAIRQAPLLLVRQAPRADVLKLHGCDGIVCGERLRPCLELDLGCCDASVPLAGMLPDDLAGLESLRVDCPNRSTVPRLGEMTNLRHLHLVFDSLVLAPADVPPRLEVLDARARFAIGAAGAPVRRPDTLAVVRTELEGALTHAEDLFFLH
jgi:hypothetical protein